MLQEMSPGSNDTSGFYARVSRLEAERAPFVLVTLVETIGSTPQDAGAKMLVGPAGLIAGTVGGGRIEAKAISFAQDLLAHRAAPTLVNWTLKGDAGMTCGGSVKLYFEPHVAGGARWTIAIFGAGHVTQALIPVLLPLPCQIRVFDSRPEWIARLPAAWNLAAQTCEELAGAVDSLPSGTFLLSMTQGHKTDRPILLRALSGEKFPYLGCIGSEAKAAVLRQELTSDGIAPDRLARLHCPIGSDFGTNHPHEIALSIAAQLLSERDRLAVLTG